MANNLLASPAVLVLPIEVVGADLDGQQYIERTLTSLVTRDGAMVLLASKLAPESELIVRNVRTNREALARVVGHIGESAAGHVYGIAFADPGVDLWGAPFSPAESRPPILLECSRCHIVRAFAVTEIEREIFKSTGILTLRCDCAGTSTIWKRTELPVSEERRKIAPETIPAAVAEPTPSPRPQHERRGSKRSALKPAACVRHGDREEVVSCDDISRGGLCFRSRKRYAEGTRLEVAVPFAPSGSNIFVPARVVYSQELSSESHRHGVAYLKTTKPQDSPNA
ncbi:MAG: PilZ domain-containing protein [Acidobacteriia bacterium]|nr:PilZ domain-containing protein [Terriglobia bacterium]